jgi:hypothetical protein
LAACFSGCTRSSDDGQSDDSALSLSDLSKMIQTFKSVQARRPFGPTDAFSSFVAVPDARSVCASSNDPVCPNLVAAEGQTGDEGRATWSAVRDALRTRVLQRGSQPLGEIVAGDALRYWVRERVASLTAYYAIQDEAPTVFAGTSTPNDVTPDRVNAFLTRYYPLYHGPTDFALTRAILRPADVPECTAANKTDAVVIIPGVLRTEVRKEFDDQIATVTKALPCIDMRRVEFGSFDDPDTRIVPEVQKLVAQIDHDNAVKLPLHVIGYSQGVVTAVRMLAQDKDLGGRTRSVLAMNGASHGSEAADFALEMADSLNTCGTSGVCNLLRSDALKILAETFLGVSLSADSASDNLGDVLAQKREGMVSLTTAYARKFWDGDAANIPKNAPDALFYTFRSGISRTDADPNVGNLPQAQVSLYNIIFDRGGATPWNDMQVRVVNHTLGGPVAPREVVSRVAEGNHWQWQLRPDEGLPRMEPEMASRTPRASIFHAYFRALAEIGLVGNR